MEGSVLSSAPVMRISSFTGSVELDNGSMKGSSGQPVVMDSSRSAHDLQAATLVGVTVMEDGGLAPAGGHGNSSLVVQGQQQQQPGSTSGEGPNGSSPPSTNPAPGEKTKLNRPKTYKASLQEVLYFFKTGRKPPPEFADLGKEERKKRLHTLSEFSRTFVYDSHNDTLYHLSKQGKKGENLPPRKLKVLFTRAEIESALDDMHRSGPSGTHLGVKRTQNNISEMYYWRSITEDVKDWIATCAECQKAPRSKTIIPKMPPVDIYARQPWEVVGVDLVGPVTKSALGHTFVLTATCLFSKWVEAEAVMDKAPENLYHGLMKWIHRWGVPLRLICDHSKKFGLKKLNDLIYRKLGIKHLMTTCYHPTSSHEAHTTSLLRRQLTKMVNDKQDNWHLYLEEACWVLRSTYSDSMKYTPYEVMHIRKPRFPSEVPPEDEPALVNVQEPTPHQVADYVSRRQEVVSFNSWMPCTYTAQWQQ